MVQRETKSWEQAIMKSIPQRKVADHNESM